METVLNFILNPNSLQTLLLLVFGCCGLVWVKTGFDKKMDGLDHKIDLVESSLNKKMDGLDHKIDLVESSLNRRMDGLDHKIDLVEVSLNRRIDGVEASLTAKISELKHNDFAHLNEAVIALTYTMEKNGIFTKEDKEFVDSRLER